MDTEFAEQVCKLNTRFYANNSTSFSDTRHASWQGWQHVCESVRTHLLSSAPFTENHILRVADIACGNLRFEAHLMQELPQTSLQVVAFDNCESLLPDHIPSSPCASIRFCYSDIMEELQANTLNALLCEQAPSSDLVVSFGFMHHVPLPTWRSALVQALISATSAGGLVVLSLWRFLDNEPMAVKARRSHEQALEALGWQQQAHQFGSQDVLLGWQNKPGAYRFCHSFTTQEIDQLIYSVSDRAEVVARFRSDGRTHDLNEYLVLQVKAR